MHWNNKLGYFGFLGLLGLIGLSGNHSFFGFFGFFAYLRYFTVIPDELFRENVRKAATPSFFTGITVAALAATVISFMKNASIPAENILALSLALSFALPVFVFTVYCYTWNFVKAAVVHDGLGDQNKGIPSKI